MANKLCYRSTQSKSMQKRAEKRRAGGKERKKATGHTSRGKKAKIRSYTITLDRSSTLGRFRFIDISVRSVLLRVLSWQSE